MSKWYVKFDNKRRHEIHGPMSEEEALDKGARLDGMAFSERIFEPQFVTTKEVDEIFAALGVLSTWTQEPHRGLEGLRTEIRVVAERAKKALILLSKKPQPSEPSIEDLLRRGGQQIKQIEERPKLDLDHQSILNVLIEAMEVISSLSRETAIEDIED